VRLVILAEITAADLGSLETAVDLAPSVTADVDFERLHFLVGTGVAFSCQSRPVPNRLLPQAPRIPHLSVSPALLQTPPLQPLD